jgi:hypothetical protein
MQTPETSNLDSGEGGAVRTTLSKLDGSRMSTLRPKVLGWMSIALGAAAIAMPAATARLIGARRGRTTTTLLRGVGARELGVGVGLLAGKRPAAGTLWLRVLGDALDLSLLFGAMATPRAKRERLLGAVGVIAGVTLLDFVAASMQSHEERAATS